MKTPQEIKAFVKHCKDIAKELDKRGGQFDHVELFDDGNVVAKFNLWTEYYKIELTQYLDTPISELRAQRAERERLEQEKTDKHLTGIARVKLKLERKEYERLKAKFE